MSRSDWPADLRRLEEDSAFDALDRAIRESPHAGTPLGDVLKERGEYEAALAQADRALALDGEGVRAWVLRTEIFSEQCLWDQAEASAADAVATRPRSVRLRTTLGSVFSGQEKYEEALAAYDQALAIDPRHDGAQGSRVNALRNMRRWPEAEAAAEALVAAHPNDPDAWCTKGWLLSARDQDEDAVTAYEHALVLSPRHIWSLRSPLNALRALRRWPEAEAAAREFVTARPFDSASHIALGRVHEGRERYAEALLCAEAARGTNPTAVDAREYEVRCKLRLLRFAEAEADARSMVQDLPASVPARILLAEVLGAQHKYTEALQLLEGAYALDPRDQALNVLRSAMLRSLRCFTEADAVLRRLARPAPALPEPAVGTGGGPAGTRGPPRRRRRVRRTSRRVVQ